MDSQGVVYMSASRDKSQRIGFLYSNLYAIYVKKQYKAVVLKKLIVIKNEVKK